MGHGLSGKIGSGRGTGRTSCGGGFAGPTTVDAGGLASACALVLAESMIAASAVQWAEKLEFPWALLAGLWTPYESSGATAALLCMLEELIACAELEMRNCSGRNPEMEQRSSRVD